MDIKLHTNMAGPDGCHAAGAVLTVGRQVTAKQADALLAGRFAAEHVRERFRGSPAAETASAGPQEAATARPSGKAR